MYDVALSFAGEDRNYVESVAGALVKNGINVFYDAYERTGLWGTNLYEHLAKVYKDESRYVVIFVSKHYARKVWTTHERRSAQARALVEHSEYILPARFDDTDLPGLLSTIGYLNLAGTKPSDFARLIIAKVRDSNYWCRELAEVATFSDRVLREAHRGAFLWRRDVTAIFDNRLADNDDAFFLTLRETLSAIPLLAATGEGEHPIVLLYQTSRASEVRAVVWDTFRRQCSPANWEFQKEIAYRITGTIVYSPVNGPADL